MPKSTRPRSPQSSLTQTRLQWVHKKEIDWPEDDQSNRYRAPKGVMNSAIFERILLAHPTIVLRSGNGRYTAISDPAPVLRFAGGDPGDNPAIPCLVVEDAEWDLATWVALIHWVVPWIDGDLTGRGKRRVRKQLKAYPGLAAVIAPRPERERAKDVMQATATALPPQPSVAPVASAPES